MCLLLSILVFEDSKAQQAQYAYRISFTDKSGSPSISNPLVFLSQRALDRRSNQGISVSSSDLPVSPPYLDTVLTLTQGKLHVTSRWLNSCVVLLTDSSKKSLIQSKPYISSIQYVGYFPNGLHKGGGNKFEQELKSQYKTTGTPAYYGATWDQTDFLKGDCLHDLGFKGQGKLIAVLDDGFNYVNSAPAFDSLYNSGRIIDHYNFVLADPFVYGYHSHGTEVLSIIAGNIPGTYVGAAPNAQYALYITEDQASEQPIEMDNIIAGFERADSLGADIISSSLGYNIFFGPVPYTIPSAQLDGKTTPAAKAANMAAEKGMLMVITMGNEGSGGLLTPGDADSALTVGNVTISKTPASSSGYGPNASGRVKPDVCALGQPAKAMLNSLSVFSINGTSVATPQISGFAACLWQAHPGASNYSIKAAIQKSSHLFSNPQMPQLGYGVPDFCVANGILDVNDPAKENQNVTVYPNPFEDEIMIALNSARNESVSIQIFDITGKAVFTAKQTVHTGENMLSFHLASNLTTGIYSCKITTSSRVQTLKLIKK